MTHGSKRKSIIQSYVESARMTAEVFPNNNKRKKAVVSVCSLLLPDDLILEVLLRLPVKSILRFRAVCRSWAALFSSKDFLSLYMATSKPVPAPPKLLVVSPTARLDSTAVYSCSPSCPRYDLLFNFDCVGHDSVEVVMPKPCCGLNLLHDADLPAFFVFNAATRAVQRLPPYSFRGRQSSAGLGFDARTREYKVVRLILGYFPDNDSTKCEVYTPGADCWRPAAGGLPFSWTQFAASAVTHSEMNKIPPVFANGFLHWLINPCLTVRRPRAAVITFSVAEETFGCVRSPPFWTSEVHLLSWSQSEGEHLVEMENQLCIVRDLRNRIPLRSTLEIWRLLDYSSGDWSLMHRIDLFGHVERILREPQVVRVIGSVGNCGSGKKIIIATSEHKVYDKFQKKLYTYDHIHQVLETIISTTETYNMNNSFLPGSRFSLFEESLVPVHKTIEDRATSSTLAKVTKGTTAPN
ncbi:F-box protein At5g49610 isoform X1 [Brachypodium distachyon]|uniref:F-box domain-containing protein n=1 Tax=Brachypodium distachyon TaxID=15368 RepID=A0A0Q3G369_BRADI|nr:F-box protein At5g49610 isoform X1 [Brachypodium distachyon]XP_024314855.1 F-box protein At5g49610 isoform X1 [Brachypodium distachyon]KQK04973.1 hypothetical protein BRADI_2g17100v3 [Brachypodium distachyon]PNT70746.1 hypothetical protein BRADI_2g17100v3 [Brachypodium distachyon]|eukprot:XP_010231049.2 F-box protein At5g49610 isoform X1 [Brachypodium distachyon]